MACLFFYSVQISSDNLVELQGVSGSFSSSDKMSLGVSAFYFDESEEADEYILWLRHDGPRKWLTADIGQPLVIYAAGISEGFAPLHVLRPDSGRQRGRFVEKLEFAITPGFFAAIIESGTVTLKLNTLMGSVEKQLSETELGYLRGFVQEGRLRHDAVRAATLVPDDQ